MLKELSKKTNNKSMINELKAVSRVESVKGYCYELTNKVSKDPLKRTFIIKDRVDIIKEKVSLITGVSVKDMLSGNRKLHIIKAKHIAISECVRLNYGSLGLIGKEFGLSNHSTVIHACKQVDSQYSKYINYKILVDKIRSS